MATTNILLPDPMHDLNRPDQETRQQQQVLQEAITEGLESGISHRSKDDIVKEANARLDITRLEQLRASIKPNNITSDDIDQAIESGRP